MENKNQPAFALIAAGGTIQEGLTKREYFAGLALQGLLANDWSGYRERDEDCSLMAKVAINYADALLKQLSETEKQ